MGRKAQCARLLEAINEGNKNLANVEGGMAERMRGNAAVLRATAKSVRALSLSDAGVMSLQDDYASLAEEIAAGSEATAKAIEGGNPETALEATASMGSYDERETAFTNRLVKICEE